MLPITNRKESYKILNQTQLFIAPYYTRMLQLGADAYYFPGTANTIETKSEDEQKRLLALVDKQDLNDWLPQLIATATSKLVNKHNGAIEWQQLCDTVNTTVLKDYFGLTPTPTLVKDCQVLGDWLFNQTTLSFSALPPTEQQSILQAQQRLSSLLSTALNASAKKENSHQEASSLVARAVLLIQDTSWSEQTLIGVLIGMLLAFCSQLSKLLQQLPLVWLNHSNIRNKIYQAASAGDLDGLRRMLEKFDEFQQVVCPPCLWRMATGGYQLKHRWLGDKMINKGDEISLYIGSKLIKEQPASLQYNPKAPADNFLQYGFEPQATFGRSLIATTLAACFINLFSMHRIESFSKYKLRLNKLPENPGSYHFEILGSSPPWAVAEEQNWLLNSFGVKKHTQYNILSFYEFTRLLIKKSTCFYNNSKFYVAYDKDHQILFGSPFTGGGMLTVKMGEGFHNFTAVLSTSTTPTPPPAIKFNQDLDYATIFAAYSNIRANYYTWAYFTAFLDKGYGFVIKALLVFKRHSGFKSLTFIGNGLLLLVVGLVALIQKLPLLSSWLNGFFESTVVSNLANIHASFSVLDDILADGRPYIFGEHFSAADIHLCANLVNLIVPDEFQGGGVLPPLSEYPPTYKKNIEAFRQTLTGQYVLRVYKQHRNARKLREN